VNQNKLEFLTENEASDITGDGLACWISTHAAAASLGLLCFNLYAISTVGTIIYCQ
jgi:hypothetical protein